MRRLALILLACLVALAVAGCGSSSDSSSSSESSSESTATTGESSTSNESSTAAKEAGGSEKSSGDKEKTKPKVTVPSGPPPKKLEIKEIEKGSGPEAKAGDKIVVQYVGVGYESKKEFDSSWSRNEPFPLTLGANGVIPGWEQGIEGMKVGGRRELIIPPNLAYGAAGSPPVIGPNETLIFVVDLLEIK